MRLDRQMPACSAAALRAGMPGHVDLLATVDDRRG
jgi:hypothetical protein